MAQDIIERRRSGTSSVYCEAINLRSCTSCSKPTGAGRCYNSLKVWRSEGSTKAHSGGWGVTSASIVFQHDPLADICWQERLRALEGELEEVDEDVKPTVKRTGSQTASTSAKKRPRQSGKVVDLTCDSD